MACCAPCALCTRPGRRRDHYDYKACMCNIYRWMNLRSTRRPHPHLAANLPSAPRGCRSTAPSSATRISRHRGSPGRGWTSPRPRLTRRIWALRRWRLSSATSSSDLAGSSEARWGHIGHTSSPVFRRMPQDLHRGREQPARRGLPAFSHGAAAKLRCQAWAPVCSLGAVKGMCWLWAAWSAGGSSCGLASHCSLHSAIQPSGGWEANMVCACAVGVCFPFALMSARAVVGANAGREQDSSVLTCSQLFSPPLCCAMEPCRAILGRTAFLYSAGKVSRGFFANPPFSSYTFPKNFGSENKKAVLPESPLQPPAMHQGGMRTWRTSENKRGLFSPGLALSCRPWTQGDSAMPHVRPRCLGS